MADGDVTVERDTTLGFSTRAIHAGQPPDPNTGAVVTPISLATTFAQPSVGELPGGFEYGRTGNPTRAAYEACVASLEGGTDAVAFASGLSAEDALLRLVPPGRMVVLGDDAYGGTFRLISAVHGAEGRGHAAFDLTEPGKLEANWPDDCDMVWLETPTNPLLTCLDIEAIAAVAHAHDALLVVDNTFASPALQRPLALGADLVVHSATKYLGGHSDVVGGIVVTAREELAQRLRYLQNAVGAVPSPFDCYLVLRGIKTLSVRMERQSANALAVAEALAVHPQVERVLYPGLNDHPTHSVATRQMSGGSGLGGRAFGGMVSFVCRGGESAALEVVTHTRLFTLAESLGAVESLIEHPGRMTHASAAGSPLEVPAALVRCSVGLEDADDLVADLSQALNRLG
ncbi:MAG: cystathionine gamma-synthase [Microthrixaceae bacterium]